MGVPIDEDTLGLVEFEEWQRAFDNLGYFPCSHDICRNTIQLANNYSNRQWWMDSRRHNVLTITDWLKMISESVTNHTADLAVDRLRQSPLRILTELLVSNYDSSKQL